MQIPQYRLELWTYQFMLGTLSKKKTKLLKREIRKRNRDDNLFTELERKFLAAFTVERPSRKYLADLFKSDEERKFGKVL